MKCHFLASTKNVKKITFIKLTAFLFLPVCSRYPLLFVDLQKTKVLSYARNMN